MKGSTLTCERTCNCPSESMRRAASAGQLKRGEARSISSRETRTLSSGIGKLTFREHMCKDAASSGGWMIEGSIWLLVEANARPDERAHPHFRVHQRSVGRTALALAEELAGNVRDVLGWREGDHRVRPSV